MTEPKQARKGRGIGLAAALAAGLVLASPALMDHLHKWEEGPKRQLTVYADKLAAGLPTVCMGLTRHVTTTPIIVGQTWSEAKCEREERAAVQKVQLQVLQCLERVPPQGVLDTASEHAWNFGAGATCGSGFMAAWNRGDWYAGCRLTTFGHDGRRIWSYTKTGKTLPNGKPEMQFVRGLANRRDDALRMCMRGAAA